LRLQALNVARNRFVEALRERGIGTSVHCIPLNTMAFYQQRYGYRTGDFPVAEGVYSRCLSLPIFPAMSDEDVAYVIESVLAIARENRR
jgi:dTDP-4-amino-4,6-dideoxygalactose transaminase